MYNSEEYVTIAFYKNGKSLIHKIIRWWSKSDYSHAELIMPDSVTWVSISPFSNSRVNLKIKTKYKEGCWDFIKIPLNPRQPVREYQLKQLYKFIEDTQGLKYDWTGMILSQFGPFIVKNKNKWYCSEWIAHALQYSRIIMWDDIKTYNTPDMSPGKLYNILKNFAPEHYK